MPNPKQCAAIVVGIDAYTFKPLTSCVNDAIAMREALIEHELVDASRILLFLAPGVPSEGAVMVNTDPLPAFEIPTRDALAAALFQVCKKGDDIERFYFYFAGHGVLRHVDSARSRTSSVVIPSDVTDLESEGTKLIDLSDLVGKFSLRGPQEQVFIVDACRDMAYEREPDVGPLGWTFGDEGLQRKQAVIQSVPPLGKAEGQSGGHGVFTKHFLDALNGAGTAKDYDDAHDGYVVRVKSALDYARGQIERSLKNVPLWKLSYRLPQVGGDGYDDMEPLRVLSSSAVPDVPFTIHVEPEEAAAVTQIEVRHRGFALNAQSMPPRLNHQPVGLRPDRYRVMAASRAGVPDPSQALIDTRETDSITVRVGGVVGPVPPAGPPPAPGSEPPVSPSRATAFFSPVSPASQAKRSPLAPGRLYRLRPTTGRLIATALEPQTRIEVESLQPPLTQLTGVGTLSAKVLPGAYEVRFRLGSDVFSKTQVYIDPREDLTVTAQADFSPLVSEAVGVSAGPSISVSEKIGDIQGALPSTLLTLVGLKSFDASNAILRRFEGVVPLHDSRDYADRPVVVVLAYDGIGWKQDPPSLLASARIRVALNGGKESPVSVPLVPLLADTFPDLQKESTSGRGFQRIGIGFLRAPGDSFRVDLQSSEFGAASVAATSVDRRLSVIALNLHPDGTLDVNQSLLRIPGLQYPNEPVRDESAGRIVRDLMLGQQLYGSRELLSTPVNGASTVLRDLLFAKWTDPIVTTMTLLSEYQLRQHVEERASDANEDRLHEWQIEEATRNLVKFFPELPDVRVVNALFHDPRPIAAGETGTEAGAESFLGLIDLVVDEDIPVLQDAARALQRLLTDLGLRHRLLEETIRRARPGDVWTVRVTPEDSSEQALLTRTTQTAYANSFATAR